MSFKGLAEAAGWLLDQHTLAQGLRLNKPSKHITVPLLK
jgi:hypothetical protein